MTALADTDGPAGHRVFGREKSEPMARAAVTLPFNLVRTRSSSTDDTSTYTTTCGVAEALALRTL